MPGIPSKGCDACRKQKKKCDQKKPSCSRCERLLIKCIGSGVTRIKFTSQAFQVVNGRAKKSKVPVTAVAPRPAPSSDGSRLAIRLVSMFEMQDMRYDIYSYGLVIPDLPRYIGSSPALDAAAAAIVAAFDSLHNKSAKPVAVARHIDALAALAKAVEDPVRACTYSNMCAIYILNICQGFTVLLGDDYPKHGQIMSHLLRDVAIQGRLHEFEPRIIRTFCATTVIESFYNHDIELGPWFWDIFYLSMEPRPIYSQVHSLVSVRLDTMADIAVYLRTPEKYLYQIRTTYDIIQSEYDAIRSGARAVLDAAAKPDAKFIAKRMGGAYIAAFGTFLGLSSILNRILHIFEPNLDLVKDSERICSDTVLLAKDANPYRPLAAGVASNAVLIVWASGINAQEHGDLESAMMDYANELDRASYMYRIWTLTNWYDKLEKSWRSRTSQQLIGLEPDGVENLINAEDACVIL